jgi:hypothetical protein
MPLIETLYKTDEPQQLERSEYYQPRIEQRFRDGKWSFLVTETHAWYDDRKKEVVLRVSTLNPQADEGFATIEEASRRYDEQLRRRASDGFVHCFYVDFDSNLMQMVHKYRHL